jgi:hypothetical protein
MAICRTTKLALYGLIALCVLTTNVVAKTRADCERSYRPKLGQSGKDVSWEPTPAGLTTAMLQMAKVTAHDRVYDLGAGEGAIVIVAAKQFGATAVGIEYNPDLAQLGQCYVEAEGLADKAKVIEGDIFKTDFSSATVVTLYLVPAINLRLRPTLLDMAPGTRVISHRHMMYEWKPDDQVKRDGELAYLWIVPAKVQGVWTFKEQNGADTFMLTLAQQFQQLTGDLRINGKQSKVTGALHGADITLDLGGGRKLTGKVDKQQMVASVADGHGEKRYVGSGNLSELPK